MPDPVDDLRWHLTEAALRRDWQVVNQIIIDLEQRGPLWEQLHGYCGPATRGGFLPDWRKGCSDWETPATVGVSP